MPLAPAPAHAPRTPVSPARRTAFAVLRRVFEAGAWADRALPAEADRLRLAPRERALATQLAYGTIQRRATLDHLIECFAGRSVDALDAEALAALRLGLFQLAYLDRIPAHAAVGESVQLVKMSGSPGGARLVNAVLRRGAREARAVVAALPDATPIEAALRHSHPEWVAELWFDALGADAARALMAADNGPAEAAVRANPLRGADAAALLERLGVPGRAGAEAGLPGVPEALVLDGAFDAHGHAEWARGAFMPQSRAAMAVGRLLAPQAGERVLDLCAAPGGKTTHLAALMGGDGAVVAVERHRGRAEALRRTAARMGADAVVSVRVADAALALAHDAEAFDRVLVDPPCTDLGTLRSRPDARWRKDGAQPARLAELQGTILRTGAAALRPGGTLVYSTCTISPAENEGVVAAFLAGREDFTLDDLGADLGVWEASGMTGALQTLPHRDGTDGFFIARLRRRGPAV